MEQWHYFPLSRLLLASLSWCCRVSCFYLSRLVNCSCMLVLVDTHSRHYFFSLLSLHLTLFFIFCESSIRVAMFCTNGYCCYFQDNFQRFPLEMSYMPEVMKRLSLARQIDKISRKDSQVIFWSHVSLSVKMLLPMLWSWVSLTNLTMMIEMHFSW